MGDNGDRKVIDISEARPLMEEQPFTQSVMCETEDILHTKGLAELMEMAAGHALEDGRAFLITITGPDRIMEKATAGNRPKLLGYMAHMEVTLHERFE